jgi:hypothetical protein
MKIRPVGAQLFQADSQVDISELRAEFRNFAKESKVLLLSESKFMCETLCLL